AVEFPYFSRYAVASAPCPLRELLLSAAGAAGLPGSVGAAREFLCLARYASPRPLGVPGETEKRRRWPLYARRRTRRTPLHPCLVGEASGT
ncbi:MAG TPA: hypothetical protein VGW38_29685, partial [Chloroflexota bacterium]|nr:hypothetical protein [Chloroflexota bacterium]